MKKYRVPAHAAGVILAVFCLAVLPFCSLLQSVVRGAAVDAVSGATLELPAQPSGEFYVILNTARHADTLGDWRLFFPDDEDFSVIFEDIRCLAAKGDAAGVQMAERFQAQLPENQMRLRTEDPTLLISKVEAGRVDVAVLSRDMAEALGFSPASARGATVIELSGRGEAV